MASKEADEFRSSLCDLTVNSKPLINMLTMLAEEYQAHAQQIVDVIESHVHQAKTTEKLPALYLIDSILKNLRQSSYSSFFQQNIVNVFCHVFEQVDERTRHLMFKLRQTWNDILPARKLYALDVRVNQIDPAWPVAPLAAENKESKPPSSILVNPKFLQQSSAAGQSNAERVVVKNPPSADINEQLAQKQKELEEIKKTLEIAKAQAIIEAQKKELAELKAKMNTETSAVPLASAVKDPRAPPLVSLKDPRIQSGPLPDVWVHEVPRDPRLQNVLPDPRILKPAAIGDSRMIPTPSFVNNNPVDIAPVLESQHAEGLSSITERSLEKRDPKLANREVNSHRGGRGGHRGRGGVLIRPFLPQPGNDGRPNRQERRRDGTHFQRRPVPERALPYERPTRPDDDSKNYRRQEKSRSRSRSRSPPGSEALGGRSRTPPQKSNKRIKSRSRSPRLPLPLPTDRRSSSPGKEKLSKVSKSESATGSVSSDTKDSDIVTQPKDSNIISTVNREPSTSKVQVIAQRENLSAVFCPIPETEQVGHDQKPMDNSKNKPKPTKNSKIQIVLEIDQMKGKDTKKKSLDSIEGQKSADIKGKLPSQDEDLRKTKLVKEKKKSESESIDLPKKPRRSPVETLGRSPHKADKVKSDMYSSTSSQDIDLRKKDLPAVVHLSANSASTEQQDEDLRQNRDKTLREQWQSSKAKQMPKIPKRPRQQYRERDNTSPTLYPNSNGNEPIDALMHPDEESKSKPPADVDLRSLPIVVAQSRKDLDDSSDSDAEVLASFNKQKGTSAKSKDQTEGERKRRKRKVSSQEYDGDEDLRVRPPNPPKGKESKGDEDTDLRGKLSTGKMPDSRYEMKDEDMRKSTTGNQIGWNKFKKDNPKDFYTPKTHQSRQHEPIRPLNMNDKGLELLDQKDAIIAQAKLQLDKGEIDRAQFDEVKYRFQELELIRHAKQNKEVFLDKINGKPVNPYDQRGGSRTFPPRPQNRGHSSPHPDQMVNFIMNLSRTSNDPRVRSFIEQLQQASGRNQPVRGPLLPTPGNMNNDPRPDHASLDRLNSQESVRMGREVMYEVVIDGHPFELTMGMKPRKITIGHRQCSIQADRENREILIDGLCYYRVGDPVREVCIAGHRHTIYYQGPMTNIWIDGNQMDIRVDAPPLNVTLDGIGHDIRVDGNNNKLYINGRDVGRFGGPPREIQFGGRSYLVQFDPPPREILIDGELCKLQFGGAMPVVMIRGKAHGIRFDGPPREILIDDTPYMVPMDRPIRVKIGMRAHILGFGGPGHEVVIDSKPYEVGFNGPPRHVKIGGHMRMVRLIGDPPEVKILGEILPDEPVVPPTLPTQMPNTPMPPVRHPARPVPKGGLLPTPDFIDEDLRGRQGTQYPRHMSAVDYHHQRNAMQPAPPEVTPRAGLLPLPDQHRAQIPVHNDTVQRSDMPSNLDPRLQPNVKEAPTPAPAAVEPSPVSNMGTTNTAPVIDINMLFNKLLAHGIITKKEEEEKKEETDSLEKVPDLTSLKDTLLKQTYPGVIQRLFTGDQCSTCGLRFRHSFKEKYEAHLDWHFRQNSRDKVQHGVCRQWFIDFNDWLSYEEFSDVSEANVFLGSQEASAKVPPIAENLPLLHPDAIQCPKASGSDEDDTCYVCHEPFERFWDDDEEEWHLKDAIRIEKKTYHPVCYEDAVETSILDHSISIEEAVPSTTSSATGSSATQPVSTSASPQTPSRPEAAKPPETPKQMNAFDILSGLISKTEAKASPNSKPIGAENPLQMLAGLMKSIKPPQTSDVPAASARSTAESIPAADTVKAETLKVEPIKIEPIKSEICKTEVVEMDSIKTEPLSPTSVVPSDLCTSVNKTNANEIKITLKAEPVSESDVPSKAISIDNSVLTVSSTSVVPISQSEAGQNSATVGAAGMAVPSVTPSTAAFDLSTLPSHIVVTPAPKPRAPSAAAVHSQITVPGNYSINNAVRPGPPHHMQQIPPAIRFPSVSGQAHVGHIVRPAVINTRMQSTILPIVPMVARPPVALMNSGQTITVVGHPKIQNPIIQPRPLLGITQVMAQADSATDDDGTPVRDEPDDGIERCPTPVMDEPVDDGGSTPVRDEME